MNNSLLKLQIGPVQEFIAQARSTRDLWSGSYLLSWLMGKAAATLLEHAGTHLIFPSAYGQPLIAFHKSNGSVSDQRSLLAPNLPNILVARVPGEQADKIAKTIEKAIRDEWESIWKSVWAVHEDLAIGAAQESRFKAQTSRFLSVAWQATRETGNYAHDCRRNGWQLDAVRQVRDFVAWPAGSWSASSEKDSLTGKEEAIGEVFGATVRERFRFLFKHDDHLGAVTLVKRVWHLTYLRDRKKLKTSSNDFPIPSTRGIAMHKPEADGDLENVEALPGEKYFAVLALDGDQIGKWISGEFTDLTEQHHEDFCSSLAVFALQKARATVERHQGRLIYAGGDDVLALLPADTALACAQDLRQDFQQAASSIKGRNKKSPDCSAGISIAHFKAPLQDVIREARQAEKRAKRSPEHGGLDRSAVAVTLMKRSGETIHWGCQWDSGGLDLYKSICGAMSEKAGVKAALSARFPYRVCELLEPYLVRKTGLSNQTDAADFNASQIIPLEFGHVAQRQGNKEIAEQLEQPLQDYLKHVRGNQKQLGDIIGLCQTVAFIDRNRAPDKEDSVEENLVL